MLSIQTNVNALVGEQNLSVNSAFQSKTIQRLTSGFRINSSADDAAGLAVANRFRQRYGRITARRPQRQ
jgi:flagellin